MFLELVWVLEANDCTPAEIERGLNLLLGLANFRPRQADELREALRGYAQGLDFGDALHLALSAGDDAFVSFDKAFARKATRLRISPRVGEIREDEVREFFLRGIQTEIGGHLSARIWSFSDGVEIRREEPEMTQTGKVHPVRLQGKGKA